MIYREHVIIDPVQHWYVDGRAFMSEAAAKKYIDDKIAAEIAFDKAAGYKDGSDFRRDYEG